MRFTFLVAFILGLALGVASMLVGIDRRLERRGRVGIFNLPVGGAWLTTFGAVGYLLARYSRLGPVAMVLIAAVAALGAAAAALGLIHGWAIPGAAKDVPDERYRLQGHFAVVTRRVGGAGETGQIRYEDDGVTTLVGALPLDGKPIAEGTEVVIERIEGGIAYVELWSTIAKQLELPS